MANPRNVPPPGSMRHVGFQNGRNGVAMMDLLEREAKAMPYCLGLAGAVNMPMPRLTVLRAL